MLIFFEYFGLILSLKTLSEKAADMGCELAHVHVSNNYIEKGHVAKAKYYLEKAAIKGKIDARHHLGHFENKVKPRSEEWMLKHFKITARRIQTLDEMPEEGDV
jgi:TPR repeat protein